MKKNLMILVVIGSWNICTLTMDNDVEAKIAALKEQLQAQLIQTIKNNDSKEATLLVRRRGDIDQPDADGKTPLDHANYNPVLVQSLLEAKNSDQTKTPYWHSLYKEMPRVPKEKFEPWDV